MSVRRENLFVYGTLLLDELVTALTGIQIRSARAELQGYSRHCIVRDGRPDAYPAIRPCPSGTVIGRVLFDVDEQSMRMIDCFESDPPDYDRIEVEVTLEERKIIPAVAYVAKPSLTQWLTGEWSEAAFAKDHLKHYLSSVVPETIREAE